MKSTQFFIRTFRDPPADAVVASHRLLVQAGFIRKQGSGHYHLLPAGLRSLRKIEAVIREEMNAAGAIEFQLPQMIPAELWQKSGRYQAMGKELFRLADRHGNWNVMGPTHEESFTDLLCGLLKSYKELPLNLYQIQTKFRDEIRPRYGMIRSREFIMKDAYSFHRNDENLREIYEVMRLTYRRIFERLGLQTIAVEADSGAMGGARSEEFMIASEVGEEVLLVGEGYAGNREKTTVEYGRAATVAPSPGEKVATPGKKTIEEVSTFLGIRPEQMIKAVACVSGDQLIVVFLRADREVNEAKLKALLGVSELEAASPEQIASCGGVAGFLGPGLSSAPSRKKGKKKTDRELVCIYDASLKSGGPYVAGANEVDFHLRNYMPALTEVHDVALARAGDPVPGGKGTLKEMKGMELGHIFQLGDKYSRTMGLELLDEKGRTFHPLMGCYGIGVNRTLAAIAEQHHDEAGLAWPRVAAPFEVVLISITRSPAEIEAVAELYQSMISLGMDVLWDDREERPGVKFNDADLIGYPLRITAGKTFFAQGNLEVRVRKTGEDHLIAAADILKRIPEMLALL
ncbi:MAG: proline--tRNA ligase [Spirochaetales bacterium]|nr:proline--tRNA ligase [Spirochaetales bacterium]